MYVIEKILLRTFMSAEFNSQFEMRNSIRNSKCAMRNYLWKSCFISTTIVCAVWKIVVESDGLRSSINSEFGIRNAECGIICKNQWFISTTIVCAVWKIVVESDGLRSSINYALRITHSELAKQLHTKKAFRKRFMSFTICRLL